MKPITKAGVYDIPIDVYHSQKCCVGPSISSSGLRKLDHECPARFYAHSDLNPNPVKTDSKAFAFGRAAHTLVLGEPNFDAHFVVSPYSNFRGGDAQTWKKAQTRQVLTQDDMEIVTAMAAAQKASSQVARAFIEGAPEKSIIWKDSETGIWLKARPDWLPDKPAERWVTEYKTAVSLNRRHLSFAVFKYGYEMQAALALDGIKIVMGVEPLGMAHVVQEKDPPYLAEVRLFTSEHIDFGRLQYRKSLRKFARCVESGVWPGYTDEPVYFDTPYQTEKAMENFDDGLESDGTGDNAGA